MNTLLICGLQVTLVAVVGCLTSLAMRRWLRTSAALPIGATLGAVVLLTACAFSSWPSWLHRPDQSTASPRMEEAANPAMLRDPYLNPYVEHLVSVSTPLGTYVLPTWAESLLIGTSTLNSDQSSVDQTKKSTTLTRWSSRQWLTIFAGGTMLIGLIRLIGGLWGVRHFVRTSRPLKTPELLEQIDLLRAEMGCTPPIDVRECAHLATAATVGWRRPVILLSETWRTWSEVQLRSVLAHEIAHITRGDFLAGVAAQLGVVLHFYHPLVHWLANRLRLEQELAADALAAQVVGGSREYLHAIGELALRQTNEPLGWPAQTFLPTRRTFLRRIEMLRDLKLLSGTAPLALRWGAVAAIAAVTLVAVGLRPPGGEMGETSAVVAADKPAATPSTSKTKEQQALTPLYVPADASLVISVRGSDLNKLYHKVVEKNPQLDLFKESAIEVPNVFKLLTSCEQVTIVGYGPPGVPPGPEPPFGICARFGSKELRDELFKSLSPPSGTRENRSFAGFQYETSTSGHECLYFPDDTTVVIAPEPILQKMMLSGAKSLSPLTQTDAWKQAAGGTAVLSIDPAVMQWAATQAPVNPFVAMFSPLWDLVSNHTIGLKLDETLAVTLTTQAKDPAGAEKIKATLAVGVTMLTNMLTNVKNHPQQEISDLGQALFTSLEKHQLAVEGKQVTLSMTCEVTSLLPFAVQATTQAREEAFRNQQSYNMKLVLLAMHNYHDTFGHFPPAVVIDKESGVPHSWRVEILPYLDQALLYQQYKMNEPWDSEANKKVLALMPAQYRHRSQGGSTNTSIYAAYGDGYVFQKDDREGTKISDILDGTSNTVAIFEAKGEIPWTKPEELTIDLSNGVPNNFGFTSDGFFAGLGDASVRFINRSVDKEILKALFTRAGGFGK